MGYVRAFALLAFVGLAALYYRERGDRISAEANAAAAEKALLETSATLDRMRKDAVSAEMARLEYQQRIDALEIASYARRSEITTAPVTLACASSPGVSRALDGLRRKDAGRDAVRGANDPGGPGGPVPAPAARPAQR